MSETWYIFKYLLEKSDAALVDEVRIAIVNVIDLEKY